MPDDSYYYYTTTADPSVTPAYVLGYMSAFLIPILIIAALTIVGMWKVFVKAGKPGWAALVPIYNFIVMLEIVGRPTWWVFLLLLGLIPFVGWIATLIISIIVTHDLVKSFGKDVAYTLLILLVPFVGYLMLGFGSAKYGGPSAKQAHITPPAPTAPPTTPTTPAAPSQS